MAAKSDEDGLSVDFCRVLESCGTKWICYRRTKKPDLSVVGACNEVDVWQQEIAHRSPSNVADFNKLRLQIGVLSA